MAGAAVVGALRVNLGLNSAQFTEGLSAAQKHLKGVGAQMQRFGTQMMGVGAGLSAAVTAPLLGLGAIAVNEASEMRAALAQVEAGLASMGDAGGRSLSQLTDQANALAATSLFEDDQILSGVTAQLLTFGNVSGEVFDRAQQAAVDLSTRLDQDLKSSTIQLGKALNDPIKGLTALSRVGVSFTAEQTAQVKAMVAVGDVAGAQALILGELEKQYGGSAAAARAAASPMDRLRLALASMAGDIGAVILPVVDKLASGLEGLMGAFGKLSPQMQQVVVVVGAVAAALGPLLVAAGMVTSAIGLMLPVLATIGAPLLAIGAAVAAVGVAFYVFRDDIIPILQSFAKSVQENVGPKLAPLWDALKGAVQAIGEVFTAIFGEGAPESAVTVLKVFGEVVARVFGALIDVVTGAINVVTNILKAFGALLRGDFSAMWGCLGQAVMSALRGIGNAFQSLFPEVVGWVRRTYEGVKAWLTGKLFEVLRGVVEKVRWVSDAFFKLYDAVVGHSYIPDLVEEIADWMGPRLHSAMVVPARAATKATAEAFKALAEDSSGFLDQFLTSTERAAQRITDQITGLRFLFAQGVISEEQLTLYASRAFADFQGTLDVVETAFQTKSRGILGKTSAKDIALVFRDGLEQSRAAFDDAARNFGDAFASNMERVLRGDIRGVFLDMLSDVLRSALSQMGEALFRRSKGNPLGALLGAIKLPGLGGLTSASAGSSGVAALAGQTSAIGNLGKAESAVRVEVVPSRYFDVQVQKVAGPMTAQAAVQSFGAARSAVPRDQSRAMRFALGAG